MQLNLQVIRQEVHKQDILQPQTTTCAEYYKQFKDAGCIVYSSRKIIPTVNLPFTFRFNDKCTGSECKKVQPFWSDTVIPQMNVKLKEKKAEVRFFDSHKKATIGTLKPDILMITAGGSVNIVELKSRGEFSNANKGQLCHYLHELLKLQPYRDAVYGFLTDNIDLLLVTIFRKNKAIYFEENLAEKFSDGSALKCLCHIFSHRPHVQQSCKCRRNSETFLGARTLQRCLFWNI